jgi:hypothetical protein
MNAEDLIGRFYLPKKDRHNRFIYMCTVMTIAKRTVGHFFGDTKNRPMQITEQNTFQILPNTLVGSSQYDDNTDRAIKLLI